MIAEDSLCDKAATIVTSGAHDLVEAIMTRL